MSRKIYWMDRQVAETGAIIYQDSHDLVLFRSGMALDPDVEGPMLFKLDEEVHDGELPTLFTTPGFITTKKFLAELRRAGIDNLQSYDAIIEDPVDGRRIEDYAFVNVIGLVECANLNKSKANRIGPKIRMINELVLDASRIPDLDLFRLAEDKRFILISERVYQHLSKLGYQDIYFEEIPQAWSGEG